LGGIQWITTPEIWISLLTLTVLEIILGIDNIVFISILAGKLPAAQQAKARQTGLSLALVTRVLLLCGLTWMAKLTRLLFSPHHRMKGVEAYRMRVGDYRVISNFDRSKGVLHLLAVGHRREVYR
jgi:hypothetical protein